MACACKKGTNAAINGDMPTTKAVRSDVESKSKVNPTDQCIACAQKHYDEAWIAFNECGYEDANRRFVRGSLRAVVLHTFREWKEIGRLARECALLIQEGRDSEAVSKMELLGGMIDAEFYKANPEVKERIEKERALHEQHPVADSFAGDGEPNERPRAENPVEER